SADFGSPRSSAIRARSTAWYAGVFIWSTSASASSYRLAITSASAYASCSCGLSEPPSALAFANASSASSTSPRSVPYDARPAHASRGFGRGGEFRSRAQQGLRLFSPPRRVEPQHHGRPQRIRLGHLLDRAGQGLVGARVATVPSVETAVPVI